MIKKIAYLITACTAFISTAQCEQPMENTWYPDQNYDWGIHDAYRYATFGVGPVVIIPNVGIGYRERHCQFGWDGSLSFSSIGYAHQLTGQIVRHYYLSPYEENSAYLGFGLMGSGVFFNKGEVFGTLSTDFVFGKELARTDDSRHFIEMHVGIPTLVMGSKIWGAKATYFPLMYIKYGISF